MRTLLLSFAIALSACGGTAEDVSSSDVAITVVENAPVRRGTNTFTLTTAADAINVDVTAWMPSMGHGAPNDPRVTKQNDSTYLVEDAVFSMPGTWELKVNVTTPTKGGSRTFRYEVP